MNGAGVSVLLYEESVISTQKDQIHGANFLGINKPFFVAHLALCSRVLMRINDVKAFWSDWSDCRS